MNNNGLDTRTAELKTLFDQQVSERGTQEQRWEDYAGWTLPYLFTRDTANDQEMQHDYQALGAQAVNHLSNKIVMTLFAPARPFFRLELNQEQQNQLIDAGLTPENIETLTGKVENQAMRNMEKVALRTSVIMAIKNLIALGNTMVYFPPNGDKSQVYNLRDYTVKRDMGGKVVQIITRDRRVIGTLPAEMREQCKMNGHKDHDKISLFTGITRRPADGKFFVKQEIDELFIVDPDGTGLYNEEDLPWMALTWNLIRGEDYGVGLVEEYAGDFSVYSKLSESNLNLASIAADIKILVNPMGQTDVDTLNNSESGTYVYGTIDDVAYLQLEKMSDFAFVDKIMDTYARRIGSAFLLNSQVTRDAERVTATEIQLQANELESSLGGVYSRLAEEMQQPLARQLLATVDSELKDIEPVILTGIESLSRNSEHEQMMLFLNDLTIFNNVPEQLLGTIKLIDMAKILATNRGIEHDKFMKTTDELNRERKAAEDAAAEQEAKMSAANAAGQQAGNPTTI
jgi:hypothetical protein